MRGGDVLREGGLDREPLGFAGRPAIAVALIERHLLPGQQRQRIGEAAVLLADQAQVMAVGDRYRIDPRPTSLGLAGAPTSGRVIVLVVVKLMHAAPFTQGGSHGTWQQGSCAGSVTGVAPSLGSSSFVASDMGCSVP